MGDTNINAYTHKHTSLQCCISLWCSSAAVMLIEIQSEQKMLFEVGGGLCTRLTEEVRMSLIPEAECNLKPFLLPVSMTIKVAFEQLASQLSHSIIKSNDQQEAHAPP